MTVDRLQNRPRQKPSHQPNFSWSALLFLLLVSVVPIVLFTSALGLRLELPTPLDNLVNDFDLRPAIRLPRLSTSGRFIVDSLGRKVLLHGVNVVGFDPDNTAWSARAIDYLKSDWQVNAIRVRLVEDEYTKSKDRFFQNLENGYLKPARRNGLYVILVPKVHDVTTDFGGPVTDQMWLDTAARYGTDPNIIFDLLPEPHDTAIGPTVNRYLTLIPKVRAIAPDNLIFVSGTYWGREINYYAKNPLPFPNIVYRSNPYNESPDFPSLFEEVARTQPVFLGEFGADGYPPMSRQAVSDLISLADRLQIGWTAWNFNSEGCPCILADTKTYTTTPYGAIVKSALVDSSTK